LLQLASFSVAKSVVHCFGGTYWKNATLNAYCVSEEGIERILSKRRDVKLFLTRIKPDTTIGEGRELLKDFAVRNDDISPIRGGSANGILYEGEETCVIVTNKGKEKIKDGHANLGVSPGRTLPAPFFSTTDLEDQQSALYHDILYPPEHFS
jgi:hypothetical protein